MNNLESPSYHGGSVPAAQEERPEVEVILLAAAFKMVLVHDSRYGVLHETTATGGEAELSVHAAVECKFEG